MKPAAGQREFDFPRAAKLNALERVRFGTSVKSLLKALDGFIRDKEKDKVTLRVIAQSMDCSVKTAQRAVRAAEQAGFVKVWGDPTDGQANIYAIVWRAIFDLPDAPGTPVKPVSPVKSTGNPGHSDRGPRSICPVTPVNLTGDPGQIDRGAPPPPKNDKETATIRQAESQTADGGGDLNLEFKGQLAHVCDRVARQATAELPEGRTANRQRRSGWWAFEVTRDDLGRQDIVKRLFDAAVSAELLTASNLDRLRFVSATKKVRSVEKITNVTGYLVWIVETAAWNNLTTDSITKAWSQLNPGMRPINAAEIARVKGTQP